MTRSGPKSAPQGKSAPVAVANKAHFAQAYKSLGNGKVEVYDLDFAAYCQLRGLEVADLVQIETQGPQRRPARFVFQFQDPDNVISKISIEYMNSESAKHADIVRRFKKAIRPTKMRGG